MIFPKIIRGSKLENMNTYVTPIPEDSLIANAMDQIDYEDNWAGISQVKVDESELPVLFFHSFPNWFRALMGLREVIARVIGLKTAHGMDIAKQMREFKGEPGQSIALFHVLDREPGEIMMGENDSHLNFRLSFISREVEQGTEVMLATTVHFQNRVGRLYFLPVKPIHRLVVPVLLRRMIKKLEQGKGREQLSFS